MQQGAEHSVTWPGGVSLCLGLGAQKAGTTWLHETLASHPQCRPFPIKEVHYFDTMAGKGRTGHVLAERRARQLRKKNPAHRDLPRIERLQALLESGRPDDQAYVDLLTERAREGDVALDISPSYGTLDADVLARMAALEPARFILILREPVARFWSGVRMFVNMAQKPADDVFEERARAFVDRILDSAKPMPARAGILARGDYAGMLARIDAAIPRDRALVLFFEDLFNQATLDRVTDFLGLSRMALTDTSARLSGRPARLRPDQVARATDLLRPQYDAVLARFGDAVPTAWHARFAPGAVAAAG